MQVTDITPLLVVFACLLCVASLVARFQPFFREEIARDAMNSRHRHESLDGIRGLLAFGVFFHHAVVSYYFHRTGRWEQPASGVYSALGSVCVSFFFMITGFLFWQKAIASNGRLNVVRLLLNRARRIGPLYLFSVAVCVIVILHLHGWQRRDSISDLARFGVLSLFMGLVDLPSFNGARIASINAGVMWTLKHEWRYYLVLPALALLAPGRRFVFLVLLVIAGGVLAPQYVRLTFLSGMACAYLARRPTVKKLACQHSLSLLWFLPMLAIPGTSDPWRLQCHAILLLPAFLSMAAGNHIYGLLTMPGMKVLGMVSYSVYLLHGIILLLGMTPFKAPIRADQFDPYDFWLIVGGLAMVVFFVSCLTFRWIELPVMRAGRRGLAKDVATARGEA